MRVARLDLLRYGHFTGRSIPLPQNGTDFHIVFGPNEAGKSTALAAIEDLLFGIPMQSRFGFLHEYRDMRVGARLEHDGASLEIVRRKGNRETLLDTDEVAIPEGESALAPFLSGADRAFFERMFSLDHPRLQQGGREILEARDEIGQVLFSAGAGIGGLRQRLAALEREADAIWGPRRAARRRYTQAVDRLEQADRELREHTLTASQWQNYRERLDAANQAYADVADELERRSAEARRVARIRRVYREVRQRFELESRIADLGPVIELPEDAGEQLADAERVEADAGIRIEILADQLRQAREQLAGIPCDHRLLAAEDEAERLQVWGIEVARGQRDLPKREAELDAAGQALRRLAAELGVQATETEAIVAAIPSRAALAAVRVLGQQRGGLAAALAAADAALRDSQAQCEHLDRQLAAIPPVPDRERLAAVVRAVRELGDPGARLQAAQAAARDAATRVEQLAVALHPPVSAIAGLPEVPAPPLAAIQAQRDRMRELDQRLADLSRERDAAGVELTRARQQYQEALTAGEVITRDQLQAVRKHRNRLWRLVKARHLGTGAVCAEDREWMDRSGADPLTAFEPALHEADAVADRRFEQAETLGRLDEQARRIRGGEAVDAELRGQQDRLLEQQAAQRAEWAQMWDAAPFAPLDPDTMLDWMETRRGLLDALQAQAAAQARLESERQGEQAARKRLLEAMADVGGTGDELAAEPVAVLLERASERLARLQEAARERQTLQQARAEAERDRLRRTAQHGSADAAWQDWRRRWDSAVTGLGLHAGAEVEEIDRQLASFEEMRELAQQMAALQHDRIDRIRADAAEFERAAAALLPRVAPDLAARPAGDAVRVLKQRLDAARAAHEREQEQHNEIRRLEEALAARERDRRAAHESIGHLLQAARVERIDELREALRRSDQWRRLNGERDRVVASLEREGDGLPPTALAQECADVDIDRLAAQEETLHEQLAELRQRLAASAERRSEAREAFEALGGGDAAARAASERQEALAEMRDAAEQYVQARTAATVLRWAIDRYRRRKQGPLLRRAGELFALLTLGTFQALRVDYDDQDRPQLTGLRDGNRAVPVLGLSTGTADQLYLALRVASVEDYLETAPTLPFVADDLFINFDDARAGAGLEVLARLAQRTQVLFFTHHRHLVDIARERLGSAVQVVSLAEGGG
ncbi:hypothetical protein TVNIR_1933 [Thioalkalivibrio nitratireducens DSM 14787]|uniref:YhaN AAA domain-containing protein n=1 Tax=Thioalkalivibrio nitratireducens (strain DSM 14787 / UNIQEM 213 / ALEN2) TaxID=1255043 RepID=L0DVG4_THIND|nr:YhaN family protein [Thioalkalivibrio nitratireducens]AGA33594.1 hypothetical protein TVNIR_1933 [Thioalkalivibrio nitratireducens DSM 14787]